MLISVLTGPSKELDFTKFHFYQMDCYLILADNASKAFITLIFSIEIERPLSAGYDLMLNMILPPGSEYISAIEKTQQSSNKSWVTTKIHLNNEGFNIATLSLDTNTIVNQKNPALGIQYEVPLNSPSLDLSLHASTIIGNVLYRIDPHQQSIPIGHAYIWLAYNTKLLKVLSTQSAAEEVLSGSDILENNRVLSSRIIKAKTQYSQLMWRTTRPSLGSPFHLNAILRSADENSSALKELKDIVFTVEQRVKELENRMVEIQEEVNRITDRLLS